MKKSVKITLHVVATAAVGGALAALAAYVKDPANFNFTMEGLKHLIYVAVGGALTPVAALFVTPPHQDGTPDAPSQTPTPNP